MSERIEARRKFENALQEYITSEYGEDHWASDFVLSVVVLDMTEGAHPGATHYFHTGKGPYHAQRGLTQEQDDWLTDLKMEEREV